MLVTMTSTRLLQDERSELVRLQLGNHLRQRHAQDTTQVALARSEIAERLFEQERQRTSQLSAEVHFPLACIIWHLADHLADRHRAADGSTGCILYLLS